MSLRAVFSVFVVAMVQVADRTQNDGKRGAGREKGHKHAYCDSDSIRARIALFM